MWFFRWHRGDGPMAFWTTAWFVVFMSIGGFMLGLRYAASAGPAQAAETLGTMSFPLWISAGVLVAGLFGIAHRRRDHRKTEARSAALAEREAHKAARVAAKGRRTLSSRTGQPDSRVLPRQASPVPTTRTTPGPSAIS
ncbi:hypothetical protein ACH4A3_10980 [Streptomyces sp. NPDC018007]|uniref:hypothetical protein n=1 Tax=Streptomyces sp. NPDC018007 TaxID=3365029 RepID=UPI00378C8DC0